MVFVESSKTTHRAGHNIPAPVPYNVVKRQNVLSNAQKNRVLQCTRRYHKGIFGETNTPKTLFSPSYCKTSTVLL